MALIVKRGEVPRTPHTEFYGRDGILALEEIHGSKGFSGAFSRKMHLRRYPTVQSRPPKLLPWSLAPKPAPALPLQPFHLKTGALPCRGDYPRSRRVLLHGRTTAISVAKFDRSSPAREFFRNGEAHEILFVQEGRGVLETEYGELPFEPRLYLVVPKGTTMRLELETPRAFFLVIESTYPIEFPPHYLNPDGQATLMSPVVETEIALPKLQKPRDVRGDHAVLVKHGGGRLTRLTLGHHPFDLVGWEGALYPFSFECSRHHSIAREIHTAPPARQTFQSGSAPHNGFSICTFRGQIEGWHPDDVPAPYAHFNADSDEMMFFSDTSYGARQGVIEPGSMTFHPGALPHSPHGDAAKRSFAQRGKLSHYLAVMLDTFFEPLEITREGWACAQKDYPLSWAKAEGASGAVLSA